MRELAKTSLEALLRQYDRVGICGYPRAGKTTLSVSVAASRPVIHTDDWKGLGWSDQLLPILERLRGQRRYLVEGVQVARVARKAEELFPDDESMRIQAILWLGERMITVPCTPKQRAMGKGAGKVLRELHIMRPEMKIVSFGETREVFG